MFIARFMPCAQCGQSVDRWGGPPHRCARPRPVDDASIALRAEVARLEAGLEVGLEAYLRSRLGRFETWLAARQVRMAR